ncbi:MAG TPA: hypothetical protein VMR37_04100 [Rhabdochlamydiaceae bacterium]|nr:hypothetical protein [Rhabdochlamydiaceae bacterium]
MASIIQGFTSRFSSAASTVYSYTSQAAQIGCQLASKLGQAALKAPGIAIRTFEAIALPTDVCDRWITDSLKSFSLKKAIETPLTKEAISGITDFLKIFFDQIKLPGAAGLIKLIEDTMHKPLKIDEENYASLVNQFIAPVLTSENVNKAATCILGTVRHLVHAVAEAEKQPEANKKNDELLRQLGIDTSFEDFKKTAQSDLRSNMTLLINKLASLTAEGKTPVVGALLKIAVLIVGGILSIFSNELSESAYRFALQHYLNFAACQNGDLTLNFLGMQFKLPQAEMKQLHEKFKDYKEILFWFFIRQTTLQFAHFKDQPAHVDEEWHGLLDELEPILSKTVDSAAAHTTPSSWTGTALKAIGGTFLKYMGVGMTTSFLYQIEPSTLINSLTKGLRNGFFSHQTQ